MTYNLITILGPTAVGKTRLGAFLANRFSGEIISADSRQVYKGMDIGTGKDLKDYFVENNLIPYYLIDVIEPAEEFNLFKFSELFYSAFDIINSKNKIPFLVGGTGLYLHSILKKYDLKKVNLNGYRYNELDQKDIEELRAILKKLNSKLHNTTDLELKERVIKAIIVAENESGGKNKSNSVIKSLNIGVGADRELVKDRITKRLKHRLENGMIDEVKKLLEDGITFEKLDFFGLEYKFIGRYLKGELKYDMMFEKLNIAIRQFAKRQMTWFRKMEREGIEIHWLDGADYNSAEQIILQNYFS